MFYYSPLDRDPHLKLIRYRPKTVFLMTKLGDDRPQLVTDITSRLETYLTQRGYSLMDANDRLTGGDYLNKIWEAVLSVPVGIVILTEGMSASTIGNIFYELGMMDNLGKETLIIKESNFSIPSDFVRTDLLVYGDDFEEKMDCFVARLTERVEYFDVMAEQLIADPLLAIDFLRRAYLLTGDTSFRDRANVIREANSFAPHLNMVLDGFLKYS